MKNIVKKFIRSIERVPILGRFIRVMEGIYRSPTYIQFETEQLPSLLQTISELNHRLLVTENNENNLVNSVPVTLRKITRDIVETQGQLTNLANTIDERLIESQDQLKNLLNLVAADAQKIKDLSNSAEYLFRRVEFVRRELMYEMKYGGNEPQSNMCASDKIEVEPRILSPEKLEDAINNNRVYLNLGCGHLPLKGYLNVDRRELPGIDIIAEIDKLPFGKRKVNKIYSAHLLEHFPQEQLRRELLPYYFNLLKKNGEFRAVVPDTEAMINEYKDGKYSYDHMREVFFGAQDYDGDFHYNMFTPDSLSKLLREAGFRETSIVESSRKNGNCYEFEIVGIK